MRVYKNGICREIDQKREQEFREKGYVVEGEIVIDTAEVFKQENKVLKAENEALKQENEALKAHTGGEENAGIRTGNEVKEITARGEGSATSEQTTTTGQIKAIARGRK